MKRYDLILVREWVSVAIFVFVCVFLLVVLLLIALFLGDVSKLTMYLILLSWMGLIVFFFSRMYDKLLVKYKRTLVICDEYFEYQNRRIYWKDVIWYRSEMTSAIMNAFVIGVKDASPIKLVVTNKKGKELEVWNEVRSVLERSLVHKVECYYNSIYWRKKLFKAGIILVLIVLFLAILIYLIY